LKSLPSSRFEASGKEVWMKRTRSKPLIVLFAILLVASLGGLYYAYETPAEAKFPKTLYEYQNQGIFDYTATLLPNMIYNNKTTLGPGEGTLFRKIITSVALNFTYKFSSSNSSNITVSYKAFEHVTTPQWTKIIGETPEGTLNTTGTEADILINDLPTLDVSSIEYLVNKIDQETGNYVTQYTVNATVQIGVDANYDGGSISDLFNPQLTVSFTPAAAAGDIISIGSLENSTTGSVTKSVTVQHPWVVTERNIFSGFSVASVMGFAVASWLYVRGSPPHEATPDEMFEEFIAPYEEIMFETDGEPKNEEGTTIVMVKTLENLVRLADVLSKPVLQTRKSEGRIEFQVVDGNTRYMYEATASELSKGTAGEED
jgi:hypothetical protein